MKFTNCQISEYFCTERWKCHFDEIWPEISELTFRLQRTLKVIKVQCNTHAFLLLFHSNYDSIFLYAISLQ